MDLNLHIFTIILFIIVMNCNIKCNTQGKIKEAQSSETSHFMPFF